MNTPRSLAKARTAKELEASKPRAAKLAPDAVWVVIDEEGKPSYAATWPEACHAHIADAIQEHDIVEAGQWVVRKYKLAEDRP